MSSLRAVKAAAARIGAAVEDEKFGKRHTCRVEAPSGHFWSGSGTHELIDVADIPGKPDYRDILELMAYGIEVCPDGDACGQCNGESDE